MPDSKVNILVSAITAGAVKAIQNVQKAFKDVDTAMAESGKKMSDFGSKMTTMGNNIYSIGSKATLAISMPLASASKSIIQTGAEMKAMSQTFDTVFKDTKAEAKDWATRLGADIGLSSGVVDQTNLQFRKMAGAFGLTGRDALSFSEKWTQLTMDVSAFNDVDISEATERMQSGLRGEADAVERLGIFMGEAQLKQQMMSMGLKGQYSDLDMIKKQEVLYALAIKQTTEAHGQAHREAKSYQHSLANLKQTYKDFSSMMFSAVEPALLGFMDKLNGVLKSLMKLSPAQQVLLAKIALFLIVVPPIIMYLGIFVESCGRLYSIMGALRLAMAESAIGFLGWGGIILGVIAVGYLLFRNWDAVCKIAGQVKTAVIDLATKGIAMAKNEFEYLKKKIPELYDAMIKLKDEAIKAVKDAWTDFCKVIQDNKALIETMAGILTAVFAPALLVSGVNAVIAGTQITVSYISAIITAGAEAVIAGVKIAINFVGSMLASASISVWAGAIVLSGFVKSIITAGAEALITAGKITVGLIGAMVSYAVEGWFTVATIVAQTVAWLAQQIAVIAVTVATFAYNAILLVCQGIMLVVTAVTWALGVAFTFLCSPIGLVVLAIIALIAIGVALYKNWDTIKAMAQTAWKQISDKVMNEVDYLKGRLQAFKDWFKGLFSGVKVPKFSFTGSMNPAMWATAGMPKVDVSWNAKGGIFSKPTIFGNQGVGEAGAEAIIPLSNKSATASFADSIASNFLSHLPDITKQSDNGNVVIHVASMTVSEEKDIEKIGQELYKLQQRESRRMGRSGR